jgi:hypothetical protein
MEARAEKEYKRTENEYELLVRQLTSALGTKCSVNVRKWTSIWRETFHVYGERILNLGRETTIEKVHRFPQGIETTPQNA